MERVPSDTCNNPSATGLPEGVTRKEQNCQRIRPPLTWPRVLICADPNPPPPTRPTHEKQNNKKIAGTEPVWPLSALTAAGNVSAFSPIKCIQHNPNAMKLSPASAKKVAKSVGRMNATLLRTSLRTSRRGRPLKLKKS